MKSKYKTQFKFGHVLGMVLIALLLAAIIAGDVVCSVFASSITMQLAGTGTSFDGENVEKVLALGDEMCQEIADDGIVLLKNNGALPLASSNRKVNLFGWASSDNGFLYKGRGSASATISAEKKVTLQQAFKDEGFEVNTELLDKYTSFCSERKDFQSDNTTSASYLIEPKRDWYDGTGENGNTLLANAKEFSNTAIITLTRYGAEAMEIPYTQTKYDRYDGMGKDETRTYLQLSTEEEALIEMCIENFEHVVVILNICNAMQLDFLVHYEGIDAALFVSTTGQSGTRAIPRVISGKTNPSGRTTDTFTYDHRIDPSWANKRKSTSNQITYAEDIYFGYKWYETAAVEGFYDDVDNEFGKGYDGVVAYPFGFGLSYTQFKWEVDRVSFKNGDKISDKNIKFEIDVAVTNTGNVPGKEVVQVYFTPPYYEGGIEKAHVNLLDFAKTDILKPGETQVVKLSFDLYDMASYDCYDKNGNNNRGYELDPGTYHVKLMHNAHELADIDGADITFEIEDIGESGVMRGIAYKQDPTTGARVRNRFTGDSAYAGYAIDGTTDGSTVVYLSRADFKGTFPKAEAGIHMNAAVLAASDYVWDVNDNVVERPTQSSNGSAGELLLATTANGGAATKDQLETREGLIYNEELIKELGSDYNSEKWDLLLNQMTENDIRDIVAFGGFGIKPIVSIGKTHLFEVDGPSGFNSGIMELQSGKNKWTGYPSEYLVGSTWNKFTLFQYGRAIGAEGQETGCSAIYAPGVNLHRTPYNGRYYEYYSEDAVLSGKLAAEFIAGAKTNGVNAYIKHFIVSEMGINPKGTYVWCTEQALRETYLKPFEIAVKTGGANAVMTAFNRLGAVWAGGNKALCWDILRTEWGFRGSVISDYVVNGNDPYMSCTTAIRAGGDVILNGSETTNLTLTSDANLYYARRAAKNALYAYTNAIYTQMTYDGVPDRFSTEVGIRTTEKVFAWWIPVLIAFNVVVFLGAVALMYHILVRANAAPYLAGKNRGKHVSEVEPKPKKSAASPSKSATKPPVQDVFVDSPMQYQATPTPAVTHGLDSDLEAKLEKLDKIDELIAVQLELIAVLKDMQQPKAKPKAKSTSTKPSQPSKTQQELTALRQDLEELKKLLDK